MAETLIIAAPASGSGKTLITLSLLALMRQRGVLVSSAKVGPDYIDPAFHAAATGRDCLNLDPWAMGPGDLARHLEAAARDAELLVIEGVMGLFDGTADGSGSTADLAARFGLPVVLVLDCSRQGRSVAAVAAGFKNFRKDVNVAGIILNRVASERHGETLATFVEKATGLPVVGKVMRRADMELPSRHLGLVQAAEHADMAAFLERAADTVARDISLCRLANLTRPLRIPDTLRSPARRLPPLGQRIAVAHDEAFAFAYPHMLKDWRAQGAEILPFSPLADEPPHPDADAVFLPGGYPELHAGRLSACSAFREGMTRAAERGALIYGECGGYMVLGETLEDAEGAIHSMCGLLPLSTSFAKRKLHLGYRKLEHHSPLPFPARLRGHEFHYATTTAAGDLPPLFLARDSLGKELAPMGMRKDRVTGSFAHVISCAPPEPAS